MLIRQFYLNYILSIASSLQAHLEGIRHLPESYQNLHYYPQVTYDFVGNDGEPHLARFRIIPTDDRPESGRLSKEKQRTVWLVNYC